MSSCLGIFPFHVRRARLLLAIVQLACCCSDTGCTAASSALGWLLTLQLLSALCLWVGSSCYAV